MTSDNVIDLSSHFVQPQNEPDPALSLDEIVDDLKKRQNLNGVLIIGWDDNWNLAVGSTGLTAKDTLWLLKKMEIYTLGIAEDPGLFDEP